MNNNTKKRDLENLATKYKELTLEIMEKSSFDFNYSYGRFLIDAKSVMNNETSSFKTTKISFTFFALMGWGLFKGFKSKSIYQKLEALNDRLDKHFENYNLHKKLINEKWN